jgi:hypothetical protein
MHNFKLKIYLITDEKGITQKVDLLPKPSCTCHEKKSCCHILAVQHLNGINIAEIYKQPNLSKLIKSKNAGATGRKRRGHKKNTVRQEMSTVNKTLEQQAEQHYIPTVTESVEHPQAEQQLFQTVVVDN